ncbi:MAG TPA: DUF177 domain-containing protein [Thermoleophilaceae bacterium]|nr:DUF177 domain-containing protein [Thermoleophilaceae bacterium]
MAPLSDTFELGRLGLTSGEGRRLELSVRLGELVLGAQEYAAPGETPVVLDVSRTTAGWALRLRFEAELDGPCMRCLEPAGHGLAVDAREVDQPGGGEDLACPYLEDDVLDLAAWARDALALALPAQIACRDDCRGLCPICGENLNRAGDEHEHESEPDPRWAKLSEIRFD